MMYILFRFPIFQSMLLILTAEEPRDGINAVFGDPAFHKAIALSIVHLKNWEIILDFTTMVKGIKL